VKRTLLVACALFGCGRTHLTQAKPHAIVDQRPIDFGQTPVLFPVERDVLVVNGGRVALNLTGVAAQGQGFSAAPAALQLAAGASGAVHAVFTPPHAGAFAGTLSLQTDDPDLPSVSIALKGVATLAGALTVTPSSIDFGRVGEGETATRKITLASTGAADLYLASLAASPTGFGVVGSAHTPATLAAGAQLDLAVSFSPSPAAPETSGALAIDSSDPAQPHLEVPLAGSINHAPLAVARDSVAGQPLQTGSLLATVGSTVALDGTASTDADGDYPLTYAWSLAAAPVGSNAAVAAPAAAQTTLQLDQPGVYSVLLVATDSTGLPSLAPSRLDIRAAPTEQLVVQLIWDQIPPDLDLHFLQQGAARDSAGDCYWANPTPAWGPVDEGDQLVGYGPETVKWAAPATGTYSIAAVYAADHGAQNPATNAQVRIYVQGVLAADLTHAFKSVGEVWNAATLSWPSGQVLTP